MYDRDKLNFTSGLVFVVIYGNYLHEPYERLDVNTLCLSNRFCVARSRSRESIDSGHDNAYFRFA